MAKPDPTPILVQYRLDELAKRIALARRAREMTQADLAHMSAVGLSTISSIEAGHPGVSMANFLKVLRGLDLLDQVDTWLDPSKDRVIIDRGIEASQPGRGRTPTQAQPLRTIRG